MYMYKEVEEIKRKQAAEKAKRKNKMCVQFIKEFFTIYTPDFIKQCKIKDTEEKNISKTRFIIQYELASTNHEECKDVKIEKVDNGYIVRHTHEFREAIESYTIRTPRLYKRIRKQLNKHDFNFKFNFEETYSPWNEYNRDGKYKGTIELDIFKVHHHTLSSWLDYNLLGSRV
ncbi:hypothetical protein ABEY63_01005 [Priestia aryabhattai]|uniref:hypothetical protein n=1 Tax=Priestia aryabhattai TaxID=412384 RepID=UPI002E1AB467|nr:hypothetical protein [Priestia aryabhattai]MED4259728.1 hypothetical protein [Priestia aryabhattai]